MTEEKEGPGIGQNPEAEKEAQASANNTTTSLVKSPPQPWEPKLPALRHVLTPEVKRLFKRLPWSFRRAIAVKPGPNITYRQQYDFVEQLVDLLCDHGWSDAQMENLWQVYPWLDIGDFPPDTGLEVWDAGDDTEMPLPRGWLLANVFARGFMSSLLADGGVGKTALRYAQALSLACGRELTGEHIFQRCRVLIISARPCSLASTGGVHGSAG
jgi:AAA domain